MRDQIRVGMMPRLSSKFRTVMDSAPSAVLATAADGTLIYLNGSAEDLLGYCPGSLSGRHVGTILVSGQAWPPEEMERLPGCWCGYLVVRGASGDYRRMALNMWACEDSAEDGEICVALFRPTTREQPRLASAQPEWLTSLGPRDFQLLELMAEGFSNKEIASILAMSVWTVNKSVSQTLHVMNARSRTEACIMAIKSGLIL